MSNRLDEYFVAEAGDYLDQLQTLLSGSMVPDPDGVVRLARGVRGSTRMAGSESIANLAGRLEEVARSMVGPEPQWDDDVLDAARLTVTEIRSLVDSLAHWGTAEDERVQRCQERWSEILTREAAYEAPVVFIESLFYDDDGPHIIEPNDTAGARVPVVPIGSLLFRGESAIRHARSLRSSFDAAIHGGSGDDTLAALVDELFDLLDLSLTPDLPEA
jgi:HPt (histidine-containing phosphotransfer) domain-containing protein